MRRRIKQKFEIMQHPGLSKSETTTMAYTETLLRRRRRRRKEDLEGDWMEEGRRTEGGGGRRRKGGQENDSVIPEAANNVGPSHLFLFPHLKEKSALHKHHCAAPEKAGGDVSWSLQGTCCSWAPGDTSHALGSLLFLHSVTILQALSHASAISAHTSLCSLHCFLSLPLDHRLFH